MWKVWGAAVNAMSATTESKMGENQPGISNQSKQFGFQVKGLIIYNTLFSAFFFLAALGKHLGTLPRVAEDDLQ